MPGGRRDDTCDHGLSRRSLRVKTSYELGWKIKVMIEKNKNKKMELIGCSKNQAINRILEKYCSSKCSENSGEP